MTGGGGFHVSYEVREQSDNRDAFYVFHLPSSNPDNGDRTSSFAEGTHATGISWQSSLRSGSGGWLLFGVTVAWFGAIYQ